MDLVYEIHDSPDHPTHSLPSSPPSFGFREEFEFYDALNFPVDAAQPSRPNDFWGASLPINEETLVDTVTRQSINN
jgi:hypothetical protein